MARDDRRRERGRSYEPRGGPTPPFAPWFNRLTDAIKANLKGLPAETAEVFTAQGVDKTLVPPVLAARLWKAVPDDLRLSIPFLGERDKPWIMEYAGSAIVLFFTSLLTDLAEVDDGFKQGVIKAFGFIDPSGGMVSRVATITEGSFEGMLEGLGHATTRNLMELAKMEPALREAKLATSLATWDEWRRIARTRLGRLTGDTSTPAPAALLIPATTTSATTPATAGVRKNLMMAQKIRQMLNDPAQRADGERARDIYAHFDAELIAIVDDPAVSSKGEFDADQALSVMLTGNNIDHVCPHPVDATRGMVTPVMASVFKMALAAQRKAYPPAAPPAAPATETASKWAEALTKQLPLGVNPDDAKKRGVEWCDAEAKKLERAQQAQPVRSSWDAFKRKFGF